MLGLFILNSKISQKFEYINDFFKNFKKLMYDLLNNGKILTINNYLYG